MLSNPRGTPAGIYDPPTDLGRLLPAVAGYVGYARVSVVLQVLKTTSKAMLVCPNGRPELKEWVPARSLFVSDHTSEGQSLPWGCKRIGFPLWLYERVRPAILARAKTAEPAGAAEA